MSSFKDTVNDERVHWMAHGHLNTSIVCSRRKGDIVILVLIKAILYYVFVPHTFPVVFPTTGYYSHVLVTV